MFRYPSSTTAASPAASDGTPSPVSASGEAAEPGTPSIRPSAAAPLTTPDGAPLAAAVPGASSRQPVVHDVRAPAAVLAAAAEDCVLVRSTAPAATNL